jgi:O-6-methylguanine DNA methyltransferase
MNLDSLDPKIFAWLENSKLEIEADSLFQALDALFAEGPDPDNLTQAYAELQQRLSTHRARTVYYQSLANTLLGTVFIAVTEQGVVGLNFGIQEAEFLARLAKYTSAKIVNEKAKTTEAARQINEYLHGERKEFNLSIDLRTLTPFQRQVLFATEKIPRGQVATYTEIAQRIGKPRAYRAVGQALGRNPVPLLIPCHRVIAKDGSLGGYSGGGGLQTKAQLLQLEGVQL